MAHTLVRFATLPDHVNAMEGVGAPTRSAVKERRRPPYKSKRFYLMTRIAKISVRNAVFAFSYPPTTLIDDRPFPLSVALATAASCNIYSVHISFLKPK